MDGNKYHVDGAKSFYAGFGSALADIYTEKELSEALILSRNLVAQFFNVEDDYFDIAILGTISDINNKK